MKPRAAPVYRRLMLEIRFHGRGGQGVVTTAEMLAVAAFEEGRFAQSVPSFGSERTGAPVTAFCRIDERRIRGHEPIAHPDVLIVVDPTLMRQIDVLDGARPEVQVLINTSRPAETFVAGAHGQGLAGLTVRTVPAGEIARRRLGRPLPGAALLGACSALTGVVGLPAVLAAIAHRFGEGSALAEANRAAARDGHRWIETGGEACGEPPLLEPGRVSTHA